MPHLRHEDAAVSFVTALAWYVSQPLMADDHACSEAQTSVRHAFHVLDLRRFAPVKRKEPIT
jgi:hypothetical protein